MKLKGMALQLQAVITLCMIAFIAGGCLLYNHVKLNLEKNTRLHEIAMIQNALQQYAHNHKGAIPLAENDHKFRYAVSTKPYSKDWKGQDLTAAGMNQQENGRFQYEKPGLYPADLYELCELGYLPENFLGTLGYTHNNRYLNLTSGKIATDSPQAIVTTFGNDTAKYTYKVYPHKYSDQFAQYTKYELSFTSTRWPEGVKRVVGDDGT